MRLDSSTDKDGVIDGSPLAAWLKSVPDRCTVELSDARRTLIDELITDLESARFRLPPGVEAADILAWTAGSPAQHLFPKTCEHRLVISPFLGGDLLASLPQANRKGRSVLVSRPASLAAIAKNGTIQGFDPFTLRTDAAGIDEETDATNDGIESLDQPAVGQEARLGSDLHAKVFAFDDGELATVILGSANATDAAFHMNDEVVVRITGPADTLGVRQILGESATDTDDDDRDLDLGMLLEPWFADDEAD